MYVESVPSNIVYALPVQSDDEIRAIYESGASRYAFEKFMDENDPGWRHGSKDFADWHYEIWNGGVEYGARLSREKEVL